ncbi:MAG: hypothetical protein OMM_12319 [Candidatus Magnetoglobus multicellularis str. Araruama]|uniref:Transposase DDE domain-containing protein n=1 Tax=Candidatus Magnetoglobus multicellularis str. Araruama TaxID=890399 RepID=A0A1V1NW37_9BACT|nr:MAG: hypothetical protein OMM_12319 [Candidatus Magnetoglobus multicellularis str. Araruama]
MANYLIEGFIMTILLNLDNVVLAKTGVPVTPNVGLPYMANALRHFGLPDMVNQCFNDPKNSNREIHPYNKILGSTFSLIAGGDKIEDIQKLRADNCLAHAMGFNSIMSPDTFLNFLADCNNTKNLEELNKLICLNALRKSEVQFFTYDNDATYFNSNKKCATYSYKKEKQMSGLLGFIPDLNLCTTADYRTGKVSPKTGVLNQLQDMVALAKEAGKRILNFRSDSAAHSFEIFKYCIKEHINFLSVYLKLLS